MGEARMLRKSSLAAAVALALLPAAGYGLGLGQIHSGSALNQPFTGDIDLQSVSADEIPQVKVRLAPADAFARAGVELTGSVGKLAFKPYVKENGQPAIRVTSQDPIRDPFLDFLIEVEWPQGKTVKEYTVLLDPPVFTERRGGRVRPAEATGVAAPAPTPTAEPRVVRLTPHAPAAGTEQYGPVRRGETLWSIADRHKPAGVSTQQELKAIFAANPQAFIRGDMNKLKAGAALRLPTPQELGVVDVQSARREYLEQAREPSQEVAGQPGAAAPAPAPSTPPPEPDDRLRLLTPPPGAEEEAPASAAAGPASAPGAFRQDLLLAQEKAESALQAAEQLQGRVTDLETQLRDMQRLVLLKDEQLAKLQLQGGAAGTAASAPAPTAAPVAPSEPQTAAVPVHPAVTETAPATPAPAATAEAAAPIETPPAPPAPAPASAPTPEGVEAKPVEAKPVEPAPAVAAKHVEESAAMPVAQPAAPPPPAPAVHPAEPAPVAATPAPAPKPAPAGGFAALLKDPASLIGIGVAGIGVLGALLWAIAGRRRKIEVAGVGPAAEPTPAPPTPAATPARTPAAPPVEQEAARLEPLAAAAAVAGAATVVAKAEPAEPERVSTEDLAALELSTTDLFGLKGETTEVDPTEEADVYIAYGRYEQAEQLLRLALEMEPNRLALKHKLLEVYFASRDASAYSALFSEMKAGGKDAEDPAAWQRALRMGRQLSPGDPVFAGSTAEEEDLEAALRVAEEGLTADIDAAPAAGLGELKVDTRFSEAAPDLDGGSVLNDLSLDLGTEELGDKGSHPFKLDVSEELSELRAPTSVTGELDDNDLAKAGGFSLEEITGQEMEQTEDRPPDLSGIELTIETGSGEQDTTMLHADTTLELVDDVETKLDLARAYIELGDGEGARVMLREVVEEGNDAQKASAEAMLKELS
jgi:pilus assembly protein FimV